MESKKCRGCGTVKPLTDYYRSSRDGHASKCKACQKAYCRAYVATPEGRAKRAVVRRRYYEKNRERLYQDRHRNDRLHPEKKRARSLVGHRIERGHWKRQPCEICGLKDAQAHHPDYLKPLDVVWLCHDHHIAAHQRQEDILCNPKDTEN